MSEIKNLTVIQDILGNNSFKLSELFKKAVIELENISTSHNRTIEITSLYLRTPLTNDDVHSLDINYWFSAKAYLKHLKENSEWNQEYKIANHTSPVKTIGSSDLSRITIRLPQGKEQWDSVRLLNLAADEIAKVENVNILDCIYHGYIDDDAIDHPFINIYYSN